MAIETAITDRILNCIPSKTTENDWHIENALAAGIIEAPVAIPLAIDLREPTWWKIGDQLDSGSCVGWGTGDAVCRWHFVKAGKLAKDQLLSVRYLWMAAKEMDEFTTWPTTFIETDGTSLKAALDIARKYGVVTDPILPFRVPDSAGALTLEKLYRGGTPNTFYALASKLKIANYFNLGTNQDAWRTWLATKGPILTALGVDATWDNATATHGNLDVYKPNTVRGGHCVAFVGYTKDRFIVRNSWGTGWGDKGFAYASLAYAKDAFKEAYGISI